MSSFPDLPRGFAEGDVIDGKYRIERRLGEGGMGVVLAARHLKLDRQVALKVLGDAQRRDAAAVVRMLREARAAAKLESENVAKVLDVAESEQGDPYIVMEMLSGADLSEVLRQRGRLSVADASDYLLQACQALAEAHQHGIVHRDLKPANLFLCQRADGSELVKVLDFGISKLATSDLGVATATQSVFGSPLYMSPEQLRSSKKVDARADIWALGVILFELLSGETPFQATTVPELSILIATEAPRSLAALRPDVPTGVLEVIARCLEKDVARRYASVGAFAKALAVFGSDNAAHSLRRIGGLERSMASTQDQPIVAVSAQTAQSPTGRAWGATSRAPGTARRTTSLLIAAGALGLLGVGGWFLRGGGAAPVGPESASAVPVSSGPVSSPSSLVASPAAPSAVSSSVADTRAAPVPSVEPSVATAAASAAPVVRGKAKPRPRPASPAAPESLGGRF